MTSESENWESNASPRDNEHESAVQYARPADPRGYVRRLFFVVLLAYQQALSVLLADASLLNGFWRREQRNLYLRRGGGKGALSRVALIIRVRNSYLTIGWGLVRLLQTSSRDYLVPRSPSWRGSVDVEEVLEVMLDSAPDNERELIERCNADAVRTLNAYRDVIALRRRTESCENLRTYEHSAYYEPGTDPDLTAAGPCGLGVAAGLATFRSIVEPLNQIHAALVGEARAITARFRKEQARLHKERGGLAVHLSPISLDLDTRGWRLSPQWRVRVRFVQKGVRSNRWVRGPGCDIGTVSRTLPRRYRARTHAVNRLSADAFLRAARPNEHELVRETDAALGNVVRAHRDLLRIRELLKKCAHLPNYEGLAPVSE